MLALEMQCIYNYSQAYTKNSWDSCVNWYNLMVLPRFVAVLQNIDIVMPCPCITLHNNMGIGSLAAEFDSHCNCPVPLRTSPAKREKNARMLRMRCARARGKLRFSTGLLGGQNESLGLGMIFPFASRFLPPILGSGADDDEAFK